MASIPAEDWDKLVVDDFNLEMDSALLMSLLDESHTENNEDERLGCVIRSLEEEIGPNTTAVDHNIGLVLEDYSEYPNYVNCMDCGPETDVPIDDGQDCLRPTRGVEDPFDWAHVEVNHTSHCDGMDQWYLDTCTSHAAGMVGFEDVRDYPPFTYEDSYSPLWQET